MNYLNFFRIYLALVKCSCRRKYFSENFDILYAYIIFSFLFVFICFVCLKRKIFKKIFSAEWARPKPSPAASHAPEAPSRRPPDPLPFPCCHRRVDPACHPPPLSPSFVFIMDREPRSQISPDSIRLLPLAQAPPPINTSHLLLVRFS